jgi:hypothetical protein
MKVLRVLAGLLGLMGLCMGTAFLFDPERDGFWSRWVVPIGFLGTGWYFLGYAFTGARAFLWYKRKSRSSIEP